MRRADSTTPAKAIRTSPRFEIDRTWILRACLVLAVIGFILVLAKASMLLFDNGNKRLERHERASEQRSASQPGLPAKPPATR